MNISQGEDEAASQLQCPPRLEGRREFFEQTRNYTNARNEEKSMSPDADRINSLTGNVTIVTTNS
jgi:hypothetical protein